MSDEFLYQESEKKQLERWNAESRSEMERKQIDKAYMPGWLNAPSWANWLHYCATRGWLFIDKEPHVYGDGHVSNHGVKSKRACEIPGVMFFRNREGYLGAGSPHWVCERRAAAAGEAP